MVIIFRKTQVRIWILLVLASFFYQIPSLEAHTANKVWFEFLPKGGYRIIIQYTLPDIKELREAYIELSQKSLAEKIYSQLIRGGEFYINETGELEFKQQNLKPDPW